MDLSLILLLEPFLSLRAFASGFSCGLLPNTGQKTWNIEHCKLNLDNVVRMAIVHKQIESTGQSLALLMIDRISRLAAIVAAFMGVDHAQC